MYKCKICKKTFTELQGLYNHIERKHINMIPENMSVEQYYYFMKTGKVNGNCVMCKQPTSWNKNTNKYNRFCDNPKCKEKYVEEFRKRMIGKYGKVHLLNDPEKQREMLANRSISGKYKWDDGTETVYTGGYEHDFLKMMDGFFDWDPSDIMMPSPHNYIYKYNGEEKFYIPDVFIPSLNLEIEIKDGGDNPNMHYKIQDVDKVKEKNKDEVMTSQKSFHYIKITNKNYTNFFNFLKEIKTQFEKYGDENKIPRIFKIEDIKTGSSNTKVLKESSEYLQESVLSDVLIRKAKRNIINNQIEKICNMSDEHIKKSELNKNGKEIHSLRDLLDAVNNLLKAARTVKAIKEIIALISLSPVLLACFKHRNDNFSDFSDAVMKSAGKRLKLDLNPLLECVACDTIEEDESLIESGYLTFSDLWENMADNITNGKVNDTLKKIQKVNVRDLEKLTDQYIKFADSSEGFKAMRNYSLSLMKKSKSKQDILYMEALINKVSHKLKDEYQKGRISKNDVIEFNDWLNKDFAKELKKKKDNYLTESFIVNESYSGRNLYFISEKNMDGEVLQPRIPDNFFTKNGYEDKTTKRVCFSSSIDGCLMGLSMNCKNKTFFVHTPEDDNIDFITPTIKQVPDSKITGEKWVTKPVKIKCVSKIQVSDDDGKPGKEFKYGDNKAELYGWKWHHVENVTESSISYQQLNNALQADTDDRIKEYMRTYDEYYKRMMKEKPDMSNHINDDVNKAIRYINDLKYSNRVNRKLADIAIRQFKNYGDTKKYISENTDINTCDDAMYLYMVFDPNKRRQLFMLNDADTKLFFGDDTYISREMGKVHLNGAGSCAVHMGDLNEEKNGKRVIKYQLMVNNPMCLGTIIECLKNEKHVRINSLYKINDSRDTFMDELKMVLKRHCSIDVSNIVQISDEVYDEKGSVVDGSSKIE